MAVVLTAPYNQGVGWFPRPLSQSNGFEQIRLPRWEIDGAEGWWAVELERSRGWILDSDRVFDRAVVSEGVRRIFPRSVQLFGDEFLDCAWTVAVESGAPRGFVSSWFSYLPGEWRRRHPENSETQWVRWEWLNAHLRAVAVGESGEAETPDPVIEHWHVVNPPRDFPLQEGRYLFSPDSECGLRVRPLSPDEGDVWDLLDEGVSLRALSPRDREIHQGMNLGRWRR